MSSATRTTAPRRKPNPTTATGGASNASLKSTQKSANNNNEESSSAPCSLRPEPIELDMPTSFTQRFSKEEPDETLMHASSIVVEALQRRKQQQQQPDCISSSSDDDIGGKTKNATTMNSTKKLTKAARAARSVSPPPPPPPTDRCFSNVCWELIHAATGFRRSEIEALRVDHDELLLGSNSDGDDDGCAADANIDGFHIEESAWGERNKRQQQQQQQQSTSRPTGVVATTSASDKELLESVDLVDLSWTDPAAVHDLRAALQSYLAALRDLKKENAVARSAKREGQVKVRTFVEKKRYAALRTRERALRMTTRRVLAGFSKIHLVDMGVERMDEETIYGHRRKAATSCSSYAGAALPSLREEEKKGKGGDGDAAPTAEQKNKKRQQNAPAPATATGAPPEADAASLSVVGDFPNLEELVVSKNPQLTQLTALPPSCRIASFASNRIELVAFPSSCAPSNLFFLSLAGNRIEDVSFLASLPQLRVCDLSLNRIHNLSATAGIIERHAAPVLSELSLIGNPICLLDGYRDTIVSRCRRTLQVLDDKPVSEAEVALYAARAENCAENATSVKVRLHILDVKNAAAMAQVKDGGGAQQATAAEQASAAAANAKKGGGDNKGGSNKAAPKKGHPQQADPSAAENAGGSEGGKPLLMAAGDFFGQTFEIADLENPPPPPEDVATAAAIGASELQQPGKGGTNDAKAQQPSRAGAAAKSAAAAAKDPKAQGGKQPQSATDAAAEGAALPDAAGAPKFSFSWDIAVGPDAAMKLATPMILHVSLGEHSSDADAAAAHQPQPSSQQPTTTTTPLGYFKVPFLQALLERDAARPIDPAQIRLAAAAASDAAAANAAISGGAAASLPSSSSATATAPTTTTTTAPTAAATTTGGGLTVTAEFTPDEGTLFAKRDAIRQLQDHLQALVVADKEAERQAALLKTPTPTGDPAAPTTTVDPKKKGAGGGAGGPNSSSKPSGGKAVPGDKNAQQQPALSDAEIQRREESAARRAEMDEVQAKIQAEERALQRLVRLGATVTATVRLVVGDVIPVPLTEEQKAALNAPPAVAEEAASSSKPPPKGKKK